jgi:hypothetical protein
MKRLVVALAVLAVGASVTMAKENSKEKKDPKGAQGAAANVATNITLKGTLTKLEKKQANGDNAKADKAGVVYLLTTIDGTKVHLTSKAAEEKSIKLEDFVGKDVRVVAKGSEVEKAGKQHLVIKTIISVKPLHGKKAKGGNAEVAAPAEVVQPAEAAPAADAPKTE